MSYKDWLGHETYSEVFSQLALLGSWQGSRDAHGRLLTGSATMPIGSVASLRHLHRTALHKHGKTPKK